MKKSAPHAAKLPNPTECTNVTRLRICPSLPAGSSLEMGDTGLPLHAVAGGVTEHT
jgi:hypothetical protein